MKRPLSYSALPSILRVLAEKAEASPQQALEWLVDFVIAEPTRGRAAERFIDVQTQMAPRNTR